MRKNIIKEKHLCQQLVLEPCSGHSEVNQGGLSLNCWCSLIDYGGLRRFDYLVQFLALVADKVYSYLTSLTLTDLKFWLVVGVGDLGVQEQLEGGVVLHLQSCPARNMEYTCHTSLSPSLMAVPRLMNILWDWCYWISVEGRPTFPEEGLEQGQVPLAGFRSAMEFRCSRS